ncbi:MAG: hypothetical protein HY978_04855 [Candidatus Liptonbacteria bacterium]|nr:hypothetical protein [Candidatus Liptonbacteria bacterium]
MAEQTEPAGKPVGVVTHYFNKIGVAIVRFNQEVAVGAHLKFRGAHTDLDVTADSLQFEHQAIAKAAKGQEVGLKVPDHVREGDQVYLAQQD